MPSAAVGVQWPAARTLLLTVFTCVVGWHAWVWLPRDLYGDGLSTWVLSDWLIDYSQGFTRRGLSGELVKLLGPPAAARTVVAALCWLVFALTCAGHLRLCRRAGSRLDALTLAALLLLPSLLPFYLYDHGAFGRKELLGYPLLLAHLWALERPDRYLRRWAPLAGLALPAQVLLHEPALLIFLPTHLLLSLDALPRRRGLALALHVPALAAFVLVLAASTPDFDAARTACARWSSAGVLDARACPSDAAAAPDSAFGTLHWSAAVASTLPRSLPASQIVAWLLAALGLGVATAWAGARAAGKHGARALPFIARYYALPFACTAPLYLLGWDVGRWIASSTTCFAMVALWHGANAMTATVTPTPTPRSPTRPASAPIQAVCILVIIVAVRLPHCCIRWPMLLAPELRAALRTITG